MAYRSQPISKLPSYRSNRRLLGVLLLLAFAVLALQLANLTLRHGADYRAQAIDNLFSYERLAAPRGNIFDAAGKPLVTNRRTWSLSFKPYGLKEEEARGVLVKLQGLLGVPSDAEIDKIIATRPRWTRHWIILRASQEQILPVLERLPELPGVREHEDYAREYIEPVIMAHLTGYVAKIQREDTVRFKRPRYEPDDEVGRAGLERQFEDELAGHPGRERALVNANSTMVSKPETLEAAAAGNNLYLTVDTRLQRRAMELLRGHTGTILLMEARTGALAVCASMPTFNAANPGESEVEGMKANFLNLAARGLYPPGSTFKIAGALAGLRNGIDPDATVVCRGSFTVPGWGRAFHCDNRAGHGPTTMVQSLQWSCNLYYFQLAQTIGPAALREGAQTFAFGSATGIDLPGEMAGQIPKTDALNPGELTNVSIGQGAILVTPLQVARAYAAVATGGTLPTPHVVRAIGQDAATAVEPPHPTTDLHLTPREVSTITEGLFRVVNARGGTASKAGFKPAWQVVGKTGTVERTGDMEDAWFAGFFPRTNPTHVFVVHVEDAKGHGGDVAAPMARDLIAEMYAGS